MPCVAHAVFVVAILIVITTAINNAVTAQRRATIMVCIGIMGEINTFQFCMNINLWNDTIWKA